MLALLKQLYDKTEAIKGKKLVYTLLSIFIIFICIGMLLGYITSPKLNQNENTMQGNVDKKPSTEKVYYVGKVVYVNPKLYPDENISYTLMDPSGNQMFLLKATDQKLAIVEGLTVKVSGVLGNTKDTKNKVLFVQEVVLKNAAN